MNSRNENRHMVDILFILTLFFVFALSALTLVILGANVYRTTVNHMNSNFDNRTSYAYITQKIRQNDEAGTITVGTFDGCDALIMTSEVNNTIYNTYLYEYDGNLCELLARADIEMTKEGGNAIMPLDSFKISSISSNLYRFSISVPDGDDMTIYIGTHSSTEGE